MDKKKWLIIGIVMLLFMIPTYIQSVNHSKILYGIRIVLDSGHGGKDMGASVDGVDEAPLNLIIVKKIENRLHRLGCEVILTRMNENDLADSHSMNRKKDDMKNRINMINDEKNDLFISIHMNKFQNESVQGFHVFYSSNNNASKELAFMIQNKVNDELNQNKEIKRGDFYLLNNARTSGVLIECGFLSNQNDRKNIQDDNFQNKLVDCIVQAIVDYFENKGFV